MIDWENGPFTPQDFTGYLKFHSDPTFWSGVVKICNARFREIVAEGERVYSKHDEGGLFIQTWHKKTKRIKPTHTAILICEKKL